MNIVKTALKTLLAVMAFSSLPVKAQDLMVNALPVDNKLRAIDSISIQRLRTREYAENATLEGLYPSWTNNYVRYASEDAPREYTIDLRHFSMPCDSRVVTSHFGYRARFRRNHCGTDIKVYVGDTIRAAFSGKVRVVDYERKGYGRYVIIRHPNGLETLYGHMSKQLVQPNQTVKAGDPVGLGGSTGFSTGPHLHFETRFVGEFINPELLFSFEAQDVRADSYVFRSTGKGVLVGQRDIVGGEQEVSEAVAKAEESHQFQQQRRERVNRSQLHKVKSGDTLSSIARKYHTTVDKLCRLNNISRNKTLSLGQIIKCS